MMRGKCRRCRKLREIYSGSKVCRSCALSNRKWLNKTITRFFDRLEGEIQRSAKDFIHDRVPPFLDDDYKEAYLENGMKLLKKVKQHD